MANNKEEAGKGTPRPGEMPASRRPYATIDVQGDRGRGPGPACGHGRGQAGCDCSGRRAIAAKSEAKPSEPRRRPLAPPALQVRKASLRLRSHRWGRVVGPPGSSPTSASGAVGAFLVLAARAVLSRTTQPPARSARGQRPGAAPGRCRERARHASATPDLRSRVDEMGRVARRVWATRRPSSPATPRRSKARSAAARRCRRSWSAVSPSSRRCWGRCPPPTRPASRRSWRRSRAGSPSCRRLRATPARRQDPGIARFDSELSAIRTEAGRLAPAPRRPQGRSRRAAAGRRQGRRRGPLTAKLAALERGAAGLPRQRGRPQRQRLAHRAVAGACQPEARHRSRRALCRRAGARRKRSAARSTSPPLERYMLRGRAGACRAGEVVPQGGQRHAGCGSRAGRCHPRRPAAVGRTLDRARAQGRPRRRRHQRRGRRRPHGGRAQGRPPRRGAGARPRSCRPRPRLPARTGSGRSRRARPSSRRWPTSRRR